MPFAISQGMVGVGLMCIGYVLRVLKDEGRIKHIEVLPVCPLMLLAVITVVSIFCNGYINMRMQQYGMIPLFWTNVLAVFIVGINICNRIEKSCKGTAVYRWLIEIGENSIVYVVLNQMVIMIAGHCLEMIGISGTGGKIVKIFIVFLVLYICNLVFTKTKLRFFIGK